MLRTLGLSTLAPLLSPAFAGCGPGDRGKLRVQPVRQLEVEPIREVLREQIALLSQRFSHASAHVTLSQQSWAMVDADRKSSRRAGRAGLVFEVGQRGQYSAHGTTDLSAAGIHTAAATLRDRAAASYQSLRPSTPLGRARDYAAELQDDPRTLPLASWLERLSALHERSRAVGGSRIVYRGSYLLVDDRTELYVGQGRDLAQRLVRTRAGVALIAQRSRRQSSVPIVELAENSGLIGLEAIELPQASLESAAERVLAMVTPTAPPKGSMSLLLAPSLAAQFARECVGAALDAETWLNGSRAADLMGQKIGSDVVTLTDDPTRPGAYGSYFFDCEGQPAAPTILIDRGRLTIPVSDRRSAALLGLARTANGRRLHPLSQARPHLSNVGFAAGQAKRADLLAAIDRGLMLEGGVYAHADPQSWRFCLRAARAHEVRGGKTTGVLYSNVDIRGDVPALLRAVEGVSAAVAFAPAPAPTAGTMGSPDLLTHAEVI